MRHFVAVKFKATDKRAYTYHWDGEGFQIGDVVKVPDRKGDGWSRATVVDFSTGAPPFPTKAILGLAPKDEPQGNGELPL